MVAPAVKAGTKAGTVVVKKVGVVRSVVVTVLVLALFHTYWVKPKLEAYDRITPWDGALPSEPFALPPGTPGQGLIPGAPWEGIVPGSYAAACFPAASAPQVQPAGWSGVAHGAGSAVREVAAGPPTRERMIGWFRWAGRKAAELYVAARNGLEGVGWTPPPVPARPAPQPGRFEVVPAGGRLSPEQVAALAVQAGWPAAEIPNVVARVMAESSGDPLARDYADGTHHGLLQLGTAEQAAYLDPGASAFDPLANLTAARRLWEARGWQPWRASDSAVRPVSFTPAACTAAVGTPDPAGEADLSGNAARARRAILAHWPGTEIGGWGERPNRTEHDERDPVTGRKASRAIDVMTYDDMAKGDAVAAYVRANWEELRVGYLIWNRTIWLAPDRSRPYKGRSPHTDHPHITLLPDDRVN